METNWIQRTFDAAEKRRDALPEWVKPTVTKTPVHVIQDQHA